MIILLRLLTIIIITLIGYTAFNLKSEWVAIVAFGGFISGIIFMASYMLQIKDKLKAYKRELEKNSVNSDETSSQVKVLQAKIEVLETALKKTLNP